MIPKKTTKMIVKDGSGNLVQLLPEIETASTIDASSDVPVSNAALASALEDIEDSLPASALLDVMEEEPTALNTTELDDEALIVWMEPPVPSWSFTINTELVSSGNKLGDIPFDLVYIKNSSSAQITVSWGDGNIETYSAENGEPVQISGNTNIYAVSHSLENLNFISHEYASAGIYTIEISSRDFDKLYICGLTEGYGARYFNTSVISINSSLPKLAGCMALDFETELMIPSDNNFYRVFAECDNLQSIPNNLFYNNPEATQFWGCFRECYSLQSIPAGLFDRNVNATDFGACFWDCHSIQSIPAGLFNYNTAATNFYGCFSNCGLQSIPTNLFANNIAATNFYGCFDNCSSINDLTIHIGSAIVNSCHYFVDNKANTTRTIYVPSGSTTQTSFNNVASSLGLTIIGE